MTAGEGGAMGERSGRPGRPGRKVGANESSPSALERLVAARSELVAATDLAWTWHGALTRKGRATSYLSHLLAVQGLVVECGGGRDEAIAALLHDALEDAPSRDERSARERTIHDRFGAAVLRIVLDCTDTLPDETGHDKRPWRARKERFLAALAGATKASHLVVACDKRHNLGDLVWDLRHEGIPTFARFNAGPAEQLWYFEAVTQVCVDAIPPRLALEFDRLLAELRAMSPAPATNRR